MHKFSSKPPIYHGHVYDLSFYVLDNDENRADSCVTVTNKEVMKGDYPMLEGIYDAHMGTTDHSWNCSTCGNRKIVCPGHFGLMKLKYPVKSPMFRDELLKWLKVTCYHCGELVVSLKKRLPANARLGELVKTVRTVKKCPHCDQPHMQVVKDKKRPLIFYRVQEEEKIVSKMEEFYNHLIEQTLDKISDETVVRVMGTSLRCHPRKFILREIRVPPNTIRPDIRRIGGARSSNSDATTLLKVIMEINETLPDEIAPVAQITADQRERYANLDMTYFSLVKGGGGGDIEILSNINKPLSSIAGHWPKKTGRIRRHLMGKRVIYMIRSVITGDSRLRINEVGIPLIHAKKIEIPEVVSERNIDRLTVYYLNGDKRYPGCKSIIKKSNGHVYRITHMDRDYQLQIGDTVMRDMIDGDVVNFNRQPSLLFSNIACMKCVVMQIGDTLRINPSVCNYFNADFDGDQMNAIVSQNIMARNEAMKICRVSRWFISPKNHAPLVGAFQDGLIGLSEITKDGLTFNKWHAMYLFGDITTHGLVFEFTKKLYTNRELVSLLLPEINFMKRKPSMYKESYASILKYNPADIEVNIKRGQLISGVLDKETSGQDKPGSIFHIIANEYGNDYALETIYNLQMIVHRFFLQHGFTVGITDINISEPAMKEVKRRIAAMILESYKVTQRLNNGKLIAPIGRTLHDYYEEEQVRALSPGDDFVNPIFADIDFSSNGLAKLIMSGSKGKTPNFVAINGAVGVQQINGKRFGPQAGWGRTSPYFTRYDPSPMASGYISMSFREGISSEVYPFMAGEARFGLISNALSTSVTGYQNRISVKNLETIIVDNLRKSTKGMNVVQPLYAECGLNPSKMEKVYYNTILISDEKFRAEYLTDIKLLNKEFHTQQTKELLEEEFEQLKADREYYRDIHLKMENYNPKEYFMENSKQMPVNIQRIIDDTVYNYSSVVEEIPVEKRVLTPKYVIDRVRNLCSNLGYIFLNEYRMKLKKKVPLHMQVATRMLSILLRSYLCTSYLLSKSVIDPLLDIIIKQTLITYKKALIDPGCSAGVLAAQCISEPMTQFVLDSKHRTGGQGGTKTNELVRVQEILGAKDTKTMKNPHMICMPREEYETNKLKVQEIANHIEMMRFDRFVLAEQVFFEEYGAPVHPKYKDEARVIEEIAKHNIGQKIPTDLSKWCLRFDINKEELILKSMKLETIVLAIRKNHPGLFVVYTPENAKSVFIRCYLRNSAFKQSQNYLDDNVLPALDAVKTTIVRGIDGLINTSVVDVIRHVKTTDGALEKKKVYGIYIIGTNMAEVLNNPYIDPYRTQSDSIEEIERVFGIAAARCKIVNELIVTSDGFNPMHCSVFADEMTYSGSVTSIQKTGLQKREMANITLRLSFQTPVQVIQDAAINGMTDRIGGISGPLIMGSVPRVGTTYNLICVDEKFIKENTTSMESVLEDL